RLPDRLGFLRFTGTARRSRRLRPARPPGLAAAHLGAPGVVAVRGPNCSPLAGPGCDTSGCGAGAGGPGRTGTPAWGAWGAWGAAIPGCSGTGASAGSGAGSWAGAGTGSPPTGIGISAGMGAGAGAAGAGRPG